MMDTFDIGIKWLLIGYKSFTFAYANMTPRDTTAT